jgi:hypothetical protein
MLSAPVLEPLTFAAFFKKCVGFGLHPLDKAGHLFGLLQGFDRGVGAGQLGLCEQRMDLAVANAVQHHGVCTPMRLGHQVVRILLARRNRALAQWAQHVVSARCGQGFKLGLNEFFADAPCHGCKTVLTIAQGYNRPPSAQAAPGD